MNISELHDGHLIGLQVDGETLTVRCVSANGIRCTVTISEVINLRATDLRLSNIILAVVVETDMTDRIKRLATELGMSPTLFASAGSCVELVPSYGCEIVAFSRRTSSVTISVDEPDLCRRL